NFVDPNFNPGAEVKRVNDRILAGYSMGEATVDQGPGGGGMEGGDKTMANVIAGAEDFNTRYGSLVGWQEAVRRIKPIPRAAAQFELSAVVNAAGAKTAAGAPRHPFPPPPTGALKATGRSTLVTFLERQLGTTDLARASTYMERPLRLIAHLIMSSPEFQLC